MNSDNMLTLRSEQTTPYSKRALLSNESHIGTQIVLSLPDVDLQQGTAGGATMQIINK